MKILVAAIAMLLCTPALADDWHHGGGDWHGGQEWHGNQQWHGGGGWGWHGGGVDMGNALIGGFVGSVIGNIFAPPVVVAPAPIIVAPAVPEIQPWTPIWYDYCGAKFKSFDAHTGYYTAYDGQPHFCQ
jgi:hypothetical protein